MNSVSAQNLFAVLLVTGCVAVSVALFFVLRMEDPEAAYQAPGGVPGAMQPEAGPVMPAPADRRRPSADAEDGISDAHLASAVLKDLLRKIATRQTAELQRLLEGAVKDPAEARAFARAVERGVFAVDVTQPLTEELNGDGSTLQWNVHLIRQPGGERERLVATLVRGGGHAWILEHVELPALDEGRDPIASDQAVENGDEDAALAAARGFLEAMGARDFARARRLAEEAGVPNEKLAALGIVLEEGGFALAENNPLLSTIITEDRAWVLARVASEAYGMKSEFGLEMTKQQDGSWLIESVNFSRLMNEFARADQGDEAFQEPLVTMPEGGQSIALYFGYDVDALSAGSLRQLGIVAEILRASSQRKITIAGHADALGDETYNESLSGRRARRVAEALRHMGVPATQISTEAFGESMPIHPNTLQDGSDNPEGRQRNRRAEIYLNF